jgi:hypothetical protein
VPLDAAWKLTVAWYGDRLSPDWAPQPIDHHQRLLEEAGLVDAFWQLS